MDKLITDVGQNGHWMGRWNAFGDGEIGNEFKGIENGNAHGVSIWMDVPWNGVR